MSKGLWRAIERDHQDDLDRLTLGEDGDYWGVVTLYEDEDWYDQPFTWSTISFQEHLRGKTRHLRNFDAVKFVALGTSGDWAFNVDGKVLYSGPASFKKAMKEAKDQGNEVLVGAPNALRSHAH